MEKLERVRVEGLSNSHGDGLRTGERLLVEAVVVEFDGKFEHLLLFLMVEVVVAQHVAQVLGLPCWSPCDFRCGRAVTGDDDQSFGKVRGHHSSRMDNGLVHVSVSVTHQRRCETQRIGSHRVDDEPVFEAVVHHRVGAGMA